jgi:hypothetical protein
VYTVRKPRCRSLLLLAALELTSWPSQSKIVLVLSEVLREMPLNSGNSRFHRAWRIYCIISWYFFLCPHETITDSLKELQTILLLPFKTIQQSITYKKKPIELGAEYQFRTPSPKCDIYNLFAFSCICMPSGPGIVQWYSAGLCAGRSGGSSPAGAGNFSFHHGVQTDSGTHAASYPMGTRDSFSGGKAARSWSWPLISTYYRGQRMRGAIPPLPQ